MSKINGLQILESMRDDIRTKLDGKEPLKLGFLRRGDNPITAAFWSWDRLDLGVLFHDNPFEQAVTEGEIRDTGTLLNLARVEGFRDGDKNFLFFYERPSPGQFRNAPYDNSLHLVLNDKVLEAIKKSEKTGEVAYFRIPSYFIRTPNINITFPHTVHWQERGNYESRVPGYNGDLSTFDSVLPSGSYEGVGSSVFVPRRQIFKIVQSVVGEEQDTLITRNGFYSLKSSMADRLNDLRATNKLTEIALEALIARSEQIQALTKVVDSIYNSNSQET